MTQGAGRPETKRTEEPSETIIENYGAPSRPGTMTSGEVFGDLTTVRIVGANRYGHLWLCTCSCGRSALRQAAALRYARSQGTFSACSECNAELRAGYLEARRRDTRATLADLYLRTGSLWSKRSVERLESTVMDDLETTLGARRPNRPDLNYAHDRRAETKEEPRIVLAQRITAFYPIAALAGEDRWWACVHCERYQTMGLWCVECLEFACRDCVRAERHVHVEEVEATSLADIARRLCNDEKDAWYKLSRKKRRAVPCPTPLTKERIRQIENIALDKVGLRFRRGLGMDLDHRRKRALQAVQNEAIRLRAANRAAVSSDAANTLAVR